MKSVTFIRLALTILLPISAVLSAEFPDAAQPQLATTNDGHVWLTFGRGPEIFVARSDDRGMTFSHPIRVAALPSLMLGRRRGPRLAAYGEKITLTVMAGELFAFHSKDGGRKWLGPTPINDVPRSAREGLHALTIAPDGRLFTTWLDLRGERTQLFSSDSTDAGATWSPNQLVYRAPNGQTVCECCHPSAQFSARGELVVMWRNGLEGARDMWSAVRPAGSDKFGASTKLGEGTWMLKACPMDGGAVFTNGDRFASVWQRSGDIFLTSPANLKNASPAAHNPSPSPRPTAPRWSGSRAPIFGSARRAQTPHRDYLRTKVVSPRSLRSTGAMTYSSPLNMAPPSSSIVFKQRLQGPKSSPPFHSPPLKPENPGLASDQPTPETTLSLCSKICSRRQRRKADESTR